jgi:riboflavin synthase
MFTGLVEGVGRVKRIVQKGGDRVLYVEPGFEMDSCKIGDSLCVNGICLTITQDQAGILSMDVSEESLSRSTLGALRSGDIVNLERALRLSDRLGGHLVSGHVDGIGKIVVKEPREGSWRFGIEIDPALSRYTIEKGSIAVDGISLTINVCQAGYFEVNIIPQTGKETTLLQKGPGSRVNIETDLIGKYIEKLISGEGKGLKKTREAAITLETLEKYGYT